MGASPPRASKAVVRTVMFPPPSRVGPSLHDLGVWSGCSTSTARVNASVLKAGWADWCGDVFVEPVSVPPPPFRVLLSTGSVGSLQGGHVFASSTVCFPSHLLVRSLVLNTHRQSRSTAVINPALVRGSRVAETRQG